MCDAMRISPGPSPGSRWCTVLQQRKTVGLMVQSLPSWHALGSIHTKDSSALLRSMSAALMEESELSLLLQ